MTDQLHGRAVVASPEFTDDRTEFLYEDVGRWAFTDEDPSGVRPEVLFFDPDG